MPDREKLELGVLINQAQSLMATARPQDGPQTAGPQPEASQPELRALMCCVTGSDTFVDRLIQGLLPRIQITKLVSGQLNDFLGAMRDYPVIWLEWGDDLAIHLTNREKSALANKRVILRIHRFELFNGKAAMIDYSCVDDLILVCNYMRDMLLKAKPEIARQVKRIHVIPNGVDLEAYRPGAARSGHDIGFVGYLALRKAPMVLMHAFETLHRADPRFRLHIAGKFQDSQIEHACRGFITANELHDKIKFHGWVEDVAAWLHDMDYVISTSLSESQGLGIQETMATGCAPLIYNFPEAESIYPREFLWRNLAELAILARQRRDPEAMRGFIKNNYSLETQLDSLRRMFLGKERVTFADYRFSG